MPCLSYAKYRYRASRLEQKADTRREINDALTAKIRLSYNACYTTPRGALVFRLRIAQ